MAPFYAMIFVLFLFPVIPSMAQWQQVSSGITGNLVAGSFADDSTGYLISAEGKVLKTVDQGGTWTLCGSLSGTFSSIFCAGPDTVYAGGNRIYRSPDRGATWIHVASPGTTITDLGFFGSKLGYYIVPEYDYCNWAGNTFTYDNFKLFRSDDFGVTWNLFSDHLESVSRIGFINDSTAYIPAGYTLNYPHCGSWYINNSRKTIDRGESWGTVQQHSMGTTYFSFLDADTGYFMSRFGRQTINKTTDGGASTASYYTLNDDQTTRECLFMNQVDAYLLGGHHIYRSSSEGVAWEFDHTSSTVLNRLFRGPANWLFSIGNEGTILRKPFIPSVHPDTIYRCALNSGYLTFGVVPVDSTRISGFTLTNTGNTPIEVRVASGDTFGISLSQTNFSDTLHVYLNRLESKPVYVKFNPKQEGFYNGLISVGGVHLQDQFIEVIGVSYAILTGNINRDTLICKDTLRIGSDITVDQGATLTLCAGMHVIFQGVFGITVHGTLEILGDSAAPVTFGVTEFFNAWKGIHLQHANQGDTSVFRHCTIDVESWTYGIFLDNSKARIEHCRISSGQSPHPAIHLLGSNSGLEMRHTDLFDCCGGGLSGINCGPCIISNCNVYGGYGNGISIESTRSPGLTDGSTVMENCSVYNTNGGISLSGKAIVTGNRIFNTGYGIRLTHSRDSLLVMNNEIYDNGNTSIAFGGLTIWYSLTRPYLVQNLVYNNSSVDDGGGIRIMDDFHYVDSIFVIGNTVCNNSVASGKFGSDLYVTGRCIFRNNIVWNRQDTVNSLVTGDNAGTWLDHNCLSQRNLPPSGSGNISADPLFTNPTLYTGSFAGGWITADWTLLQKSPCINAGNPGPFPYTPATDFAGNPRIVHGRIDMGAYEYGGPLSAGEVNLAAPCIVFPNPASGILTIRTNGFRKGELVIADFSGRTLLRSAFQGSARVNISVLPPGMYICTVSGPAGVICREKVIRE